MRAYCSYTFPFTEVMDTAIIKWHITNTSEKVTKRQEEKRTTKKKI